MTELPLTVPSKYVGSAGVGPVTLRSPVASAPLCLRFMKTSPDPMVGLWNDQVPAHFPLTSTLGGPLLPPTAAQPDSSSTTAPTRHFDPCFICSPSCQSRRGNPHAECSGT